MSTATRPAAAREHRATVPPFADSAEQVAAELGWLERALRERASQVAAGREGSDRFDAFAGLYVHDRVVPSLAPMSGALRAERAALDARAAASDAGLRLERLRRRFGLSPVAVHVLACCLAPDWSQQFQRLFALVQDDVTRRRPAVQLLGELFAIGDAAARAMFAPGAPLVSSGLLTMREGDVPFPSRQPIVADAVIDFLSGGTRLDGALAGFAMLYEPAETWPGGGWYDRHHDAVMRLARPLLAQNGLPASYVSGPAGCAKRLVVDGVCAIMSARVLRVDCRAWIAEGAQAPEQGREQARALRRDAALHGCVIHLASAEALLEPGAERYRAVADSLLADCAGIVATGTATGAEFTAVVQSPVWTLEIPRPGVAERSELWSLALGARGLVTDAQVVDGLAGSFRFTPREIDRSVEDYCLGRVTGADPQVDAGALMQACRGASRHGMHLFARRIVPTRRWEDLAVPDDTRAQLAELCAAARWRRRVHGEWGFERLLASSTGITALFAGPSGVGKTMSAEIVAGELGLELFAVDISCVVSKYIGETEKNLGGVFDEAERTNAVLFFDECDALFGKRTEIGDAHDRYANIETNYLLQRIDAYEGIVVLATNLRANLDPAFSRRIRYAIEFALPDEARREEIWRRVFPAATPLAEDVDVAFMARQFRLAGGSIRNIAVNAAFLAASEEGVVGMRHVIHATRRELQKMGRSCTRADFGRYFGWVRDAVPAAEVR